MVDVGYLSSHPAHGVSGAPRAAIARKFERGGVRRAHQLAERRDLDAADVKSMHSFFARHAVDKNTTSHKWDSDTDPSAGFIAWLLWGGDAGQRWADRHAKALY